MENPEGDHHKDAENSAATHYSASKKEDHGGRPECFSSTVTEVVFVLTCAMAIMQSSFLVGTTTVTLNLIAEDLNMSQAEITWITASSTLASGSFLLFFGRVADLFGRKSLFVGSLFLYAVFALAVGFAKTPIAVDALMGCLGLVSASAVTPAQGVLGATYEKPSRRKNLAFATFSAGNPLGFVFGILFGGIAAQIFNWRASMWLLAIIYLLGCILAFFTMPNDDADKEPFTLATLKKFDYLGTVLTIGGIGLFSSGLSLGGDAPNGWKTPYVLVTLILGVVFICIFIWWETKCKHPLVPMWIWRDRDFSLLIGILVLGFMAFSTSIFWMSLYIQRFWTSSPIMVAVYFLPLVVVGTLVNVFAGFMQHKISNSILMSVGVGAYFVAHLLLPVQRHGDSYWAFTFPAFLVVTIGADLEFVVANMYVMSTLPRNQQSVAGGIFQTVTRLCTTVGFGISTAIFQAVAQNPPTTGYYGNDPFAPYASALWFTFASVALSVFLLPFLRVGTQGHAITKTDTSNSSPVSEGQKDPKHTPTSESKEMKA